MRIPSQENIGRLPPLKYLTIYIKQLFVNNRSNVNYGILRKKRKIATVSLCALQLLLFLLENSSYLRSRYSHALACKMPKWITAPIGRMFDTLMILNSP